MAKFKKKKRHTFKMDYLLGPAPGSELETYEPPAPPVHGPNAVFDCPEDGCDGKLKRKWSEKFSRWFFGCTKWRETGCTGSHGCHPDGSPLGIPANKETKQARIAAHEAFDALWEHGTISRDQAYRWLSKEFGRDAHISKMDIEDCQRVIELVDETFYA